MNITEIQTELAALVVQMTEKGVVTPSAELHIKDSGLFSVYITSKYGSGSFGEDANSKFLHADTPLDAFGKARDYITSLPSPEEAQTREYLKRVASAIDYAAENNIADEYVTPLRGVTCAMTENLLTDQGAQS
jgi:hypothetical protein